MLRTRTAAGPDAGTSRTGTGGTAGALARNHRLPGADRAAINRLTRDRRAGRSGCSGVRRGRRHRHCGTRRAEFGGEIGTRRHHWPRDGLARQGAMGARWQRADRRTRRRWARHCRRAGACGFRRWQRSPRAGQNLPGTRRGWAGGRWNGTGSRRCRASGRNHRRRRRAGRLRRGWSSGLNRHRRRHRWSRGP